MAIVLKRIKGNLYWYEQRSFRHMGRVKTESKYIGRASAAECFAYGLKHPYGLTPTTLPDDKRELRTEYEGNGRPVGAEVTPPIPAEPPDDRYQEYSNDLGDEMREEFGPYMKGDRIDWQAYEDGTPVQEKAASKEAADQTVSDASGATSEP